MNKKNLNEKDTKNINIEQLLAVDLFDSKIFDQIDNFESIQKKDSQSDSITESLDGILKQGMQLSKIQIKTLNQLKMKLLTLMKPHYCQVKTRQVKVLLHTQFYLSLNGWGLCRFI